MDIPDFLKKLTVDDEPAVGTMVKRTLRRGGHEVTTATSAEEALELLAAEPFDLVISDLRMGPGLTGYDLARRFRMTRPEIKALLISPKGSLQIQSSWQGALLERPFSGDALKDEIRRILRR